MRDRTTRQIRRDAAGLDRNDKSDHPSVTMAFAVFPMAKQFPVRVQFDDFITAASQLPKMTRAPRGAKGSIPSDTLLSPDREGIMVETSVISSLVHGDIPWAVNASVDAKRLVAICETLKKLGASGQVIQVALEDRNLLLKFNSTTLSIPTLWAK